ncbi:PriCT-2 domain-containing protein [Prevotella sp. MGM1]|uniref:PriCT-2 domain-containing protein n=1 Tax=Prevotella sp. MGM1 TaxID=2033405 RepID=UPI000CE9D879|nr:PriCT-2 domain-containing protein [Prevotella sp. MGM1]GAY28437.1 Primase C terminal 2 [Prevotella sp. MGM1]
MFDKLCSIYTDAHDNVGRFYDRTTNSVIRQMTIRDFCLTDRWKSVVMQLRGLVDQYGAKEAKKREDYKKMKTILPGATLSGLFELREVTSEKVNRKTGELFSVTEHVSRRTAHLLQHTGFLCIDIDLQDNQSLSDMKSVLRTLRHRPEVALLMLSCSGTGYFALIPLDYPQYHKEQFRALLREYAALGIVIDKQCGDVTRIRFASYDEHPYINPNVIPYSGIDLGSQMLAPKAAVYQPHTEPSDDLVNKVGILVEKLERHHIDITNDYADWFRVGFALANLPDPWGRNFFHRVSAICQKYNASLCDQKFNALSRPDRIGIGTFFNICAQYGITLKS